LVVWWSSEACGYGIRTLGRPYWASSKTEPPARATAASAAANAINSKGDVAGFEGASSATGTAVIFQHDKTVTQLGTLGGPTSSARGVNDYDQATGTSRISSTSFLSHAFRWAKGTMTDLGSLGTGDNAFSQGVAINKSGQVAGNTGFGADGEHAFLWSKHQMIDLGVLPGTTVSAASAINTAGHVAGFAEGSGAQRGFLYRDGALVDLRPGDPSFTVAYGLNDADQVVGVSMLPSASGAMQSQAFLWDQGVIKPLGVARSTDVTSRANAINNLGVVVGVSSASSTNTVGFVYDGTTMADLNTLVNNASGWVFTGAQAINDKGQITGTGLYLGVPHPYLLTPIVK